VVVVTHADGKVAFGHTKPAVHRAATSTGGLWLGFGWGAGGWATTGNSDGALSGELSERAVPSVSEPVPQAARHADCRRTRVVRNPRRTLKTRRR